MMTKLVASSSCSWLVRSFEKSELKYFFDSKILILVKLINLHGVLFMTASFNKNNTDEPPPPPPPPAAVLCNVLYYPYPPIFYH